MDNDDLPVGRILSRREMLSIFGAAGAALVFGACSGDANGSPTASQGAASNATTGGGAAQPTSGATSAATSAATANASRTVNCVVTPELTEGPFYVDEKLDRSDIRTDSTSNRAVAGVPLVLNIGVFQASSSQCLPLAGAIVDVWQCDAAGVYSDVSGNTEDFLRGSQVTGQDGMAKFTTVYPGWYQGRAVHIHFKVRAQKDGKSYDFTSQWFFDEALNDEVFAQAPYASRGRRTTMNANDSIFRQSGKQLTLAAVKEGAGYAAPFDIAMQI
jgi:protocatechuate 3,4-dioxygenase beta subunit